MESSEERQARTIRDTLLNLPDNEIQERRKVRRDYIFYKGKSIDFERAKNDPILYGQNWPVDDNCDYKPTQDIRNKVKPLLRKQARWMFGKEPTIKFKADNKADKEKCEELRKFIEDILDDNNFWPTTKKAFLEATIKKRVLLRVEANPNFPLIVKYESVENFYYKEKNNIQAKRRIDERSEEDEDPNENKIPIDYKKTFLFGLMIAIYIFTMKPIGYFIMTPLFIIISYRFLKSTSWRNTILVSAGFTVFVYFVFVLFLKLPVPMGILG